MLAGTAGPALAANSHKDKAKVDQARRLCEKSGGTFIRVDNLVYVCLFPGGSTTLLTVGGVAPPAPGDKAGALCQRSGGLFIRVDGLVYACLFPNDTVGVGDILTILNTSPITLPPLPLV